MNIVLTPFYDGTDYSIYATRKDRKKNLWKSKKRGGDRITGFVNFTNFWVVMLEF